jgi:hypothetical protein
MKTPRNIDVLFVAGFGPIVRDPIASRKFYSDALRLPFKEDASGACRGQAYGHRILCASLQRYQRFNHGRDRTLCLTP